MSRAAGGVGGVTTATLNADITFNDEPSGRVPYVLPSIYAATGPGEKLTVVPTIGDNTITPPASASMVIVIPPAANAIAYSVQASAGAAAQAIATGVNNAKLWTAIPLPNTPAALTLRVASTDTLPWTIIFL